MGVPTPRCDVDPDAFVCSRAEVMQHQGSLGNFPNMYGMTYLLTQVGRYSLRSTYLYRQATVSTPHQPSFAVSASTGGLQGRRKGG